MSAWWLLAIVPAAVVGWFLGQVAKLVLRDIHRAVSRERR